MNKDENNIIKKDKMMKKNKIIIENNEITNCKISISDKIIKYLKSMFRNKSLNSQIFIENNINSIIKNNKENKKGPNRVEPNKLSSDNNYNFNEYLNVPLKSNNNTKLPTLII